MTSQGQQTDGPEHTGGPAVPPDENADLLHAQPGGDEEVEGEPGDEKDEGELAHRQAPMNDAADSNESIRLAKKWQNLPGEGDYADVRHLARAYLDLTFATIWLCNVLGRSYGGHGTVRAIAEYLERR